MINSTNEYEPGLLNIFCATRVKKLKTLQGMYELISAFAVFERQFLRKNIIHKELKLHHVLNSTSSLAAWSQFISNTFPSVRKALCK